MQTIAQQLNVKQFPFEIKDSNGNKIYYESSNGFWSKYEYDSNGNLIYYENSNGYWYKCEYDAKGKEIYFEHNNGDWYKREYDSNSNVIYYESSNGYIEDNRPKQKEYTMDEIAKALNINVNQLKIKK